MGDVIERDGRPDRQPNVDSTDNPTASPTKHVGKWSKTKSWLPCRFALTLPTMRALSPIKDRAFQITGAGLSSLACAPASPFLNRLTARADALALALGLEID